MSFAAPAFLLAGALGALAVAALHLLARQRPRAAPFPTARFIPERQARAASRALIPTDLLLLALRAAAMLLLGAAFARPAWEPARHGTARLLLVDRSRAVASAAEARDSARARWREGDGVVLFDSAARAAAAESLGALAVVRTPGSLAGALVAAHAAAASMAGADSVQLVIVSPLVREEWDAATGAVRAQWPGGIVLVRTTAAAAPRVPRARVVDAVTPRDSLWATDSAGALVVWPSRSLAAADGSAGAVVLGDDVVVGPFPRRTPPSAERRAPTPVVIARWNDGAPAAAERALGAGCVREVAIEPPAAGDLVLRESWIRLRAGLLGPCGGAVDARPLGDSALALLRGVGGAAPARALRAERDGAPPLTAWLLAAAALLLVGEMALRRRAA